MPGKPKVSVPLLVARVLNRNIQLLADVADFSFEPRTSVVLALVGLIPMVPLRATVMPTQEIFKLLKNDYRTRISNAFTGIR